MSRTVFPLYAGDISAFARSLNNQITASEQPPSHLELLNMLARSAGYRNYQHLRAHAQAQDLLASPKPAPVDFEQVKQQLRADSDKIRMVYNGIHVGPYLGPVDAGPVRVRRSDAAMRCDSA